MQKELLHDLGLHTNLSLFTGTGGGELATTHFLKWRTVCYVEWDKYAIEVIKARIREGYMHDAPIWDNVFTFDGRPWRGLVDVVSAGFPCQPFSVAGKGLAENDPRNGWPATVRIIGEVRPRIAWLENVPGLTRREKLVVMVLEKAWGQLNFFGESASVYKVKRGINRFIKTVYGRSYLGRVLGDLAEIGYDAEWGCLSAAAVGANHLRDRLWILAVNTECYRRPERTGQEVQPKKQGAGAKVTSDLRAQRRDVAYPESDGKIAVAMERESYKENVDALEESANVSDASGVGLRGNNIGRIRKETVGGGEDVSDSNRGRRGQQHPPAVSKRKRQPARSFAPGRRGSWWSVEPNVGRVAHGVASRVDRLRGIGNGQVPAVVVEAFHLLARRIGLTP